MQCGLCCLQNLPVGLLPALDLEVTVFFLLSRGLDLNSKGHLTCCPASGQDQPDLGTGQMNTTELPQSISVLCYP